MRWRINNGTLTDPITFSSDHPSVNKIDRYYYFYLKTHDIKPVELIRGQELEICVDPVGEQIRFFYSSLRLEIRRLGLSQPRSHEGYLEFI